MLTTSGRRRRSVVMVNITRPKMKMLNAV
jgi:hypothetical protein